MSHLNPVICSANTIGVQGSLHVQKTKGILLNKMYLGLVTVSKYTFCSQYAVCQDIMEEHTL